MCCCKAPPLKYIRNFLIHNIYVCCVQTVLCLVGLGSMFLYLSALHAVIFVALVPIIYNLVYTSVTLK